MVNILLDENVVPELIQSEAISENIFNTASKILSDDNLYRKIKQKLGLVKEKLGNERASENAAKIILEIVNEPEKI